MSGAYRVGYYARFYSSPSASAKKPPCPYLAGTFLAEDWLRGWNDAVQSR